jgi:hypothetical protein
MRRVSESEAMDGTARSLIDFKPTIILCRVDMAASFMKPRQISRAQADPEAV